MKNISIILKPVKNGFTIEIYDDAFADENDNLLWVAATPDEALAIAKNLIDDAAKPQEF